MKSLQQTLAAFLPEDKENLPRHPNPSQAGCISETPAKCCKNSDSWALPLPWFSFSKSVVGTSRFANHCSGRDKLIIRILAFSKVINGGGVGIFGGTVFAVWVCLVHCGLLSTPGICPLGVRSTPSLVRSKDTHTYFQMPPVKVAEESMLSSHQMAFPKLA